MRSIEAKMLHDVVIGLAGAAGVAVGSVTSIEDLVNKNFQPDRIVVDVLGVIAGVILCGLAARQAKRDINNYYQEL